MQPTHENTSENTHETNHNHQTHTTQIQYSHLQELTDNIPYIAMAFIGSTILLLAINHTIYARLAAITYPLYAIIGSLWIIIFVCPFCQYHGTKSCPCGYGQISALLRHANPEKPFAEKFKKHIPLIIPLWFIPPIVAVIALIINFQLTILFLTIIFLINSFIILPQLSKKYGCAHCPQKQDCHWMK